jgi:hypothetical protein
MAQFQGSERLGPVGEGFIVYLAKHFFGAQGAPIGTITKRGIR